MKSYRLLLLLLLATAFFTACKKDKEKEEGNGDPDQVFYHPDQFVMGADLSYVNQVLDMGGVFRDSGKVEDPYVIFSQYGANVARFRLWHNPLWTKEVYGASGVQMYNDFEDTKLGIQRSKALGMQVCLDFHYSDTWADPGKQIKPAAWTGLTLEVLRDSLYNYTFNTLHRLDKEGLMPEYVQTGNEINPGFLLPDGNRWNGNVNNLVYLLNAAIKAVRDAANTSTIKPKIIIHIAQPENAGYWLEGMAARGLTDYDIIGISYYYIWSSVALEQVSNYVGQIRNTFGKQVMVVETAYPWTTGWADNYNNIISTGKLVQGYPASSQGQLDYLKKLTQEIIDGGGKGIMYWEPAWITSNLKTQWGQGSSWECNTLFDFQGNVIRGMNYMSFPYVF